VLAASGPTVADLAGTARSFAEAEVVLALLRERSGAVELTHEALGLGGLLLSVPADRLRRFVDAHLGPIVEAPELVETLAAWYGENGSRAAVAARLHVHRNTVGYRIGRIRELVSADPFDPRTALQLQVALEARDVLAARDRIERPADWPTPRH
jgi:DNA-binding PucR family transcriptional regulator